MTKQEEYRFIREHTIQLVLNYRGWNLWLVGSDEGWWECKNNLTGEQPFKRTTDLGALVKAIDSQTA